MTELINVDTELTASGSLRISTIDDLSRIAKMMALSGFFADCKDAAQAGVKIMAGLELGFPAFASLTGIQIIKGRPVMGANLQAAAVKRSGRYNYRVLDHTVEACTIEFFERFNGSWESTGKSTFTIAEAQVAGLAGGDNWRKWPKNMLFARAISNGVRYFCPDLFLGAPVYTPDEIGLPVSEDGDAIIVDSVSEAKVVELIDEKTVITLYKEATSIGWLKADLKAMVSAELGISSMNDLPIELVDEYRRLIKDDPTRASYSSRGVGGNA